MSPIDCSLPFGNPKFPVFWKTNFENTENTLLAPLRSAISFFPFRGKRAIGSAIPFMGKYSLTRGLDCPVGCTGRAQPPVSRKFIISCASLRSLALSATKREKHGAPRR